MDGRMFGDMGPFDCFIDSIRDPSGGIWDTWY